MFAEFFKTVGLDIPAALIETLGTAVEAVGELTDSETIQSIGQTIQESADTLSS